MDEPMELGMKPMPKLHRFVDHDNLSIISRNLEPVTKA